MSQPASPDEVPTFAFGRNWADYIERNFSEERVKTAQEHLFGFLKMDDLRGKTFLDVGCGSGIHSLAAHRAGAARIVSLDVDEDSVRTTRHLHEREGSPKSWEVRQGSILDREFVGSLPPADIVYSWGVLHHTGSMWEAIENAAGLIGSGGIFYLALYTTTHKSPYWIGIKQEYNLAGPLKKRWMEALHILRHRVLIDLMARRSTLRWIREYKKKRGMDFMTDVRDWLGGWPYEDASIDEVVSFSHDRLDLELVRIATGEACTEYLLQRRGV